MCRRLSPVKIILSCLLMLSLDSFAAKKNAQTREPNQEKIPAIKECGTAEEVLNDFLVFYTKGEGLSFRKNSCGETNSLKYYSPGEGDPGDDINEVENYTVLNEKEPFKIQKLTYNKGTGYWTAKVLFNVLEKDNKVTPKTYDVSFVHYLIDPVKYGCIIPNDLPPVGLITENCIEKKLIKNAKRHSNWDSL